MINYSRPTIKVVATKIDYSRPDRTRVNPTPDADGVIRLRAGESITLR